MPRIDHVEPVHSFGTFTFDAGALELTREGRLVRLEPQPARALARLLASAGQVVTRDEMREAIWAAGTHVDYDRGLAYCIAQVRTALGDSGDNPRFVQTLPKRGYRFVAPVSTSSGRGEAPAAAAGVTHRPVTVASPDRVVPDQVPAASGSAAPAPWLRRGHVALAAGALVVLGVVGLLWVRAAPIRPAIVAVAIFDNETGDAGLDGFVHGLADLVVSRLTELDPTRVGVVGNAAALRQPRAIRNLKTIAGAVQADYVVLGQLQRQDAGVRVVVHFIRLDDEVHLSARRLVRDRVDISGLDDEVVREAERMVRTYVLASGTALTSRPN